MFKPLIKSMLQGLVTKARTQLDWWDQELQREHMERRDYDQDILVFPWLNYQTERVLLSQQGRGRPHYVWPVVQAAHLAKALDVPRISVIEFGVAGGNGLLALEQAAEIIETFFDVAIDVYGFDSGVGLPKPVDYRDLPNFWKESTFEMDEAKLRRRLHRGRLLIGPVGETVPAFIEDKPAPVGFISYDLDYYSSTMQALNLLAADHACLMPRVHCYFDDIMGSPYSDFTGERLAIREFNDGHRFRKLSPIHGLHYFLQRQYWHEPWPMQMFLAHIFDHPLYTRFDKLHKKPEGRNLDLQDDR